MCPNSHYESMEEPEVEPSTLIPNLVSLLLCHTTFPGGEEAGTRKHSWYNNSKWPQYLRNLSKSSLLHRDHETSPRFCPLIHSPDMIWRPSAHDGWSLSWWMPMLIWNIIKILKMTLDIFLAFYKCK